ncbi:chitin-binding domain protein cbd-1 [Aplysia californica]|uniref:Chitin-binding domain protein cbd-1 n=1 Tax=Aplysia californica TaxID=6500 RepID=A0ABM0JKX4_APLCA|nr:chitin-binding domain protein cbd-1 [Aplysia californica]
MNPAFALLILLPAAALGLNCTGVPDGNYEIGCRAYSTCTSGVWKIVQCDIDMAYNKDTGKCDDVKNVPSPCGVKQDCTGKADGRYADLSSDPKCNSYFTCADEIFMGENPCPGALVFNEKLQACDFIKAVDPPCGTKGGSSQVTSAPATAAPATAANNAPVATDAPTAAAPSA